MKKIRYILRFAVHATLAALVIATVPWLLGAALAATGDAPVVPPPTPDALMAYVQAYGWLVGGLTVAYLAAKWLLAKNESTHWIAQGRALAIVTTVVGVAGTALQAWSSGTPWSGVLVTALLGLLHLADAQVTPALAAAGAGKQGAAGMLVVLLLGGLTVGQTGCATVKSEGAAVKVAFINCTAQAIGTTPALDLATLVAIANVVAAERLKCTPAGGSLSWSCVEADLIAEGKVLGGCALVALVSAAAGATSSGASALVAATPGPLPGRAEFEDFRARAAGGATYHTAGGDI